MQLLLCIILVIVLLITIILLLPFSFIIKIGKDNKPIILYKVLFKTFGENPNPNQPIVKTLKKISGVSRLDLESIKENSKNSGFSNLVGENLSLIKNLINELIKILKKCTVKSLEINIVCAESNAADTALSYGTCYALLSPFLSLIHNTATVKAKGEKINITTDFNSNVGSFSLNAVVVTRVYTLLKTLFKLSRDESKRINSKK